MASGPIDTGGVRRDAVGEILYEFRRDGAFVRVAAIDAATNTEVIVVGSVDAGDAVLRGIARRKLAYVLAKRTRPAG